MLFWRDRKLIALAAPTAAIALAILVVVLFKGCL
jgi:hypothetical protein